MAGKYQELLIHTDIRKVRGVNGGERKLRNQEKKG
jgi:hypothetical protein